MPAEGLALCAAFFFASSQIAVKFATRTGNMMVGFLTSLTAGIVAVGALAILTVDTWQVAIGPAIMFALAGLAGPGAGRLLAMRAVRDAGATVAVPVQSSTTPVIASAGGILLFGESVGLGRGLALALIVAGIWACAYGGSANRAVNGSFPEGERPGRDRLLVLFWPVAAGAAFATMDILTKSALTVHGDPVFGSFVGLLTAYVVWVAIFVLTPQFREPIRITPSFGWFCLSGLLSAAAVLSLLFAFQIGDLSVVAPIAASQPIIVVVLGALVLRDVERLRAGTVVGACIVFLGVAFLSFT